MKPVMLMKSRFSGVPKLLFCGFKKHHSKHQHPRGPRVGPGMATTLAAIWCISSLHLNSPMRSTMVIQPGTFAKINGT